MMSKNWRSISSLQQVKLYIHKALLVCAAAYIPGKESDLWAMIGDLVGVGADVDYQDNYAGDTLLIKLARAKNLNPQFLLYLNNNMKPKLKLSNKKGEYPD